MNSSDLKIAKIAGERQISVKGRANFEYAVPLREMGAELETRERIRIDLGACEAMDSTFMGVLTMLALKLRKNSLKVELLNASETLKKLLRDLGVAKLFAFTEGELNLAGGGKEMAPGGMLATAETVVQAHRTLGEADSSNIEKFKAVVEFAEQDVERLRKPENDK